MAEFRDIKFSSSAHLFLSVCLVPHRSKVGLCLLEVFNFSAELRIVLLVLCVCVVKFFNVALHYFDIVLNLL